MLRMQISGERLLLLSIKNLWVEFHTFDGVVKAVNGINLEVNESEILGIVGESGSGKSVATHSILGLVPMPPGKVVCGEVHYGGKDLLKLSEDELNKIRGKEIGMIFQEPMTSLNPVFTIGNQIIEALKLHFSEMSSDECRVRTIDALRRVGIPSPESRIDSYPHELSGGMRQRAMIAMSLVCNPKLLIADEPTTALDVTIQAQILAIINELRDKEKLSVILITHDLAVVSETADQVAVMYAGRVVEMGSAEQIFSNPVHPYTKGLISCIPHYDEKSAGEERSVLTTIEGVVPDMRDLPLGCSFYNRCADRKDGCLKAVPSLKKCSLGQQVACFEVKGN